MEKVIFNQLARTRTRTLQLLDAVTEDAADVIPSGFNNSVRWQLGHILTVQERYASKLIGLPMDLPESYTKLFENGTKPADWDVTPPSLQVLKEELSKQTGRTQQKLDGKLETKLDEPIRGMETLGDIMANMIHHEGVHIGSISALQKAIAVMKA